MTERLALIRTPRALWRRLYFVRHLVEMLISMSVGMFLGVLLFALALGTSVDEARQQHPLAHLLVMAFAMTVPMVAWMLYRGHSRRSAGEMAAAMIAPALPLVALDVANVINGSGSGAYMNASTLAMIALIVYRRTEYRTAAAAHAERGPPAPPITGERGDPWKLRSQVGASSDVLPAVSYRTSRSSPSGSER